MRSTGCSDNAVIEFEHVSFTYPGTSRPVLRDVSFRVDDGEFLGLVGPNGAGKSTIQKLICRLYEPDSGRISYRGTDVRHLDPERFREAIAPMFQDFVRYEDSLLENIRMGNRTASDADVRSIGQELGVDDLADALPNGYLSHISRIFMDEDSSERVTLSGGQWQRVVAARSLIRDCAEIILLDEPTSALDPIHEAKFMRTLSELGSGRSVVCTTHRLSNLRAADRILVVMDGMIVEQGSHDQLVAKSGLYEKLFAEQAAGYRDE